MISTLEINTVAFCRGSLATCMANLSPAEVQWDNLPVLFCGEAWCKNAIAHPAFAENEENLNTEP